MKAMSNNIERIAGARLTELGSPSTSLGKPSRIDLQKYALNCNEYDCISCNKHLTHKIPNKLQCKAICGKPAIEVLKRRIAIVHDYNHLTEIEIREILTMSRLIQETERQLKQPTR